MLFCSNLLKDKAAVMSRPNFDPNKRKPGTKKKLTLWERPIYIPHACSTICVPANGAQPK